MLMRRDTLSHLKIELDMSLTLFGSKSVHDVHVRCVVATTNRGIGSKQKHKPFA